MTKWFHTCNKDWLLARQRFLTATDVKDLLPVTKTGRKRTVGDDSYWKVMARKLVNITPDDCVSTGAAARGHILEPYAIDEFNFAEICEQKLYHWDDALVTKTSVSPYGLAFSPDAMSIEHNGELLVKTNVPLTIAEVKSYSAERHLICGHTDKMELEERWQIATAMATCDVEEAYLIFYNPSLAAQLFVVHYDYEDLEREIDIVLDVEKNWLDFVHSMNQKDHHKIIIGSTDEEQQIINKIMKKEELNPEELKTVRK